MGVRAFGTDHPEFILPNPSAGGVKNPCLPLANCIRTDMGQSAMAQYYQHFPQDGIHQLKTKFKFSVRLCNV